MNTLLLSEHDVARMVENTEARAYADLLRAAPRDWHCVVEESESGWLLLAPPTDILPFNRILGAGLNEPARETYVRRSVDRFRAAGVRNFGVQLSPAARPVQIVDWLHASGLAAADRWNKVYRPSGDVAPVMSDLRVDLWPGCAGWGGVSDSGLTSTRHTPLMVLIVPSASHDSGCPPSA